MATAKGGREVRLYIGRLTAELQKSILPGAARAAAKVVAKQAKENLGDRHARVKGGGKVLIADAVKVSVRRTDKGYRARVYMKGPSAYPAPWLEWGTAPHFISVDDDYREGRSARRINYLDKKASKAGRDGPGHSLFINGKPAGTTVHHPGATPYPFLRPALDMKEGEAIAAAQAYIVRRLKKLGMGHNGGPPLDDDRDDG